MRRAQKYVVHDQPTILAHATVARFGQNSLLFLIDFDEFLVLEPVDGKRNVRASLETCLIHPKARSAGLDPHRDVIKQLQFRRYGKL